MYSNNDEKKAYDAAKKRVEKEREFYIHLAVYIVINISILIFKDKVLYFIDTDEKDADFFKWWHFSNLVTPIIWGIGLLFHGLWAFEKIFVFNKDWEERKIKKLMEDDNNNT